MRSLACNTNQTILSAHYTKKIVPRKERRDFNRRVRKELIKRLRSLSVLLKLFQRSLHEKNKVPCKEHRGFNRRVRKELIKKLCDLSVLYKSHSS